VNYSGLPAMAEMLRLIITPDEGPGRFVACLDGSDEPIVQGTRQPLVDGARVLLARGFDPATPLTMRHAGKTHDSFRPAPLGQWAGRTYEEGEKTSLRSSRWMPFPAGAGRQKSGSEPEVVPEGHPRGNRFYGDSPEAGECAP